MAKKLTVVGAGPGGYAAAFYAADLGMDVTLIEPRLNPGGVCLYEGCIPSKALLHVAALLNETREAERWGLHYSEPRLDLNQLRSWKQEVVSGLTGGLGDLRDKRNVTQIRARARFQSATSLRLEFDDGHTETHEADQVLLATGSRPVVLPGFPQSKRIWDSTDALELKELPKRLLVIGGGIIGMELGSVYASLGSRVSVVEMLPGLIPGADRDLLRVLEKKLLPRFEEILLKTRVTKIEEMRSTLKVHFEMPDGETRIEKYDRVLVSVGRVPNSDQLDLQAAGVATDERGFIPVDAKRRSNVAGIWAIGDLTGQPMLAHKASAEARVAVEDMDGQKGAGFDPAVIPSVVYTDPELAWCGLTEGEAKERGQKVKAVRFPWQASGRALSMDRTDGMTKLIIDSESERVLGVGMAGKGAGEMINEGVLAIEMACQASDLAGSIHAHPTLSETLMEAAEIFYGHATHFVSSKRR